MIVNLDHIGTVIMLNLCHGGLEYIVEAISKDRFKNNTPNLIK